jgi:hypothetical protein
MLRCSTELWRLALLSLPLAGCADWFGTGVDCMEGTTSCDGDRVRTCSLEADARKTEPQFRWKTTKTCKDDPQLGRYTCGMVQGMATCVSESDVDAGASSAPIQEPVWLRVSVTRDASGGMQINEVRQFLLDASPSDPAWGMAAVVSYRGSDIVDATLIPFAGDALAAISWVRGEGADRIELVGHTGQTLASVIRQQAPASVPMLARIESALESHIPSTLEVSSRRYDKKRSVTPVMLQILDQALARVPVELLVLVKEIVLELDAASEQTLYAGVFADAGSEDTRADDDEVSPLLGKRHVQRSIRDGGRLWLDFSSNALREYQVDTSGLSFDIVQTLGEIYVDVSDALSTAEMVIPGKPPKLRGTDFPSNLFDHLSDQHASLLAGGETVSTAWAALHSVACEAGLSTPYAPLGKIPASDELAVRGGFAAAEGAQGPLLDLVSYLVRANVPGLWTASPCEAIRGKALDELSPVEFVHASKLLALRGLNLLSAEALDRCAGKLRASVSANAIVMHKPDGERISFTDSLEGIRQPYFGNEVQLSWKAERSYMGLSLSVGYRGPMPSIVRLAPVGGHEGKDGRMDDDYAAVFAMTNPDGYQTGVAKGGLVVVSEVSPDVLEAYALMVLLSKEQAGTKVFPLISARITSQKCVRDDQEKCPRLVWGDAP